MQTLILCGGKGTRAYPHTVSTPKPLLDVGGVPILRHVMEIYARQGHVEFVLAAGYQLHAIEAFARDLPDHWTVHVADTGVETNTGARVRACRDLLPDRFFLTYADGLADIDLGRLQDTHEQHAGSVTMTVTPLPSPYGTVSFDETGRVDQFAEKPQLADHYINGGFFVMDDRVFDGWVGDDLERETLVDLADRGELYTYRHHGFWRSMDTHKDSLELTALWERGDAPWVG